MYTSYCDVGWDRASNRHLTEGFLCSVCERVSRLVHQANYKESQFSSSYVILGTAHFMDPIYIFTPKQQEKSPINTKSLLKRIYSLAKHPGASKRLGAALAINSIYIVFRLVLAIIRDDI